MKHISKDKVESTPHIPAYQNILQLVGNTPLAQLNFNVPCTLLAKLEYLNPGGSIKDRSALYMIEQAERTGLLKPGGTIVEASSGNQGIALAMIGALKGYSVIITVPQRTAREKIATLRAYGARVHVCPDTDTLHDPNGYHAYAEVLLKQTPGAFMPNQYFNAANVQAHYSTTGKEIWEQTNGSVTHVFLAMGTCGTISGVGRYLKEKNKSIQIIGVDAATSSLSSSQPKSYDVEGIGVDVISDTLDRTVIDEIVPVKDEPAFTMTRRLASEHGLMVGLSSGAVMHIALQRMPALTARDVVVVLFADSGRAYLSKVFGG